MWTPTSPLNWCVNTNIPHWIGVWTSTSLTNLACEHQHPSLNWCVNTNIPHWTGVWTPTSLTELVCEHQHPSLNWIMQYKHAISHTSSTTSVTGSVNPNVWHRITYSGRGDSTFIFSLFIDWNHLTMKERRTEHLEKTLKWWAGENVTHYSPEIPGWNSDLRSFIGDATSYRKKQQQMNKNKEKWETFYPLCSTVPLNGLSFSTQTFFSLR